MIVSEVGRTTSGSGSSAAGPQAAVGVLLEAVVGDHRHLLREPLDVLRLLLEVAERDEQREVGVRAARLLDRVVERALHQLPDPVAPGADHHAAADVVELGDLGVADDALEPLREVLRAGGADPGFALLVPILGAVKRCRVYGLSPRPHPCASGGVPPSASASGSTAPARRRARRARASRCGRGRSRTRSATLRLAAIPVFLVPRLQLRGTSRDPLGRRSSSG